MTHIKHMRKWIDSRLKELGKSKTDAGKALGIPPPRIFEIINGTREVKTTEIINLSNFLQWPVSLFLEKYTGSQISPALNPTTVSLPKDIPLLGSAAGAMGSTGSFIISDNHVEFLDRTVGTASLVDIYALRVTGESMAPQFNPDDLLIVSPHRPFHAGDTVIIQESNSNNGEPQAFVKTFLRHRQTAL